MAGIPPKWIGLSKSPLINLDFDTGNGYIDQNSGRWPLSPMEPAIRAILHLNPNFNFNDIDIITDRHALAGLLELAYLKTENFDLDKAYWGRKGKQFKPLQLPHRRFGVQVVGKTMVFLRTEGGAYGPRHGCRKGIERECFERQEDMKDSVSHHRILSYDFGKLRIVLRHGGDAYVDEEEEELKETLKTYHTPSGPSQQFDNLNVISGGALIPQSAIAELTTLSAQGWKRRRNPRALQKFRESYISTSPHFIVAEYDQRTNRSCYLDREGIEHAPSAAGSGSDSWEADSQQIIGYLYDALQVIVSEISKSVNEGLGSTYAVECAKNKLEVDPAPFETIPGLSDELCERLMVKSE
jgi:hypothetical protein